MENEVIAQIHERLKLAERDRQAALQELNELQNAIRQQEVLLNRIDGYEAALRQLLEVHESAKQASEDVVGKGPTEQKERKKK